MLLDQMSSDFKHKELVVESVVGRMLAEDKSGLSKLYNALNGHVAAIDFEVGDVIVPTDFTKYGYWIPNETGVRQNSRAQILSARVIAINTFANADIRIEFDIPNRDGILEQNTEWVNHTDCNKVVI
jgi:hypothetical protein